MFVPYLFVRDSCFTLNVFWCLVAVRVLRLFLKVPLVCLQFVNSVFPDHTHLLITDDNHIF